MEQTEFGITLFTLCAVSGSLLFPGVREWVRSLRKKPFLAVLIILSVLAVCLGGQRGARAVVEDPVDTIRTFRILVLLFVGVPALIYFALSTKRAGASGSLTCMALYAILAMFSATYSLFPLLSLYKGFEVAVFVALGLYAGTTLYTWQDVGDLVNILLLVLWYFIVSALIGGLVAPSVAWYWGAAGGYMSFTLSGVFPDINPNTLTQLAGIVAGCSLVWIFQVSKVSQKVGFSIVFFTALLCIVASHSRTSILAFLITLVIILTVYKKKGLAVFIMAIGGLLFLFFAIGDIIIDYFMRGQTTEQFTSLSGRTTFWPLVMEWISKSPLMGHGFYSSQKVLFGVPTVDNTYLEVLLGLGVIGLTFFCLAVVGVMINLWRAKPLAMSNRQESDHIFIWTQLVVIFIFLFCRSLTGPSFQIFHINLSIFVLVTVGAAAARRLAKENASVQVKSSKVDPGIVVFQTGGGAEIKAH